MTVCRGVVGLLPHLRRYARAMTADGACGDYCVGEALRLLSAAVTLDVQRGIRRRDLYRAFHDRIGRRGANEDRRDGAALSPVDARLQTLAGTTRAALLLSTMEGFTDAEIAFVLRMPVDAVRTEIDKGHDIIRGQIATSVLIIEDEWMIAQDLARLVGEIGHRVVGVAASRSDAVDLALDEAPGLVLADVQLADGSSGIDAAGDIRRTLNVPIVFVTAFPERLLAQTRPQPSYCITKPFQATDLQAVVRQAMFSFLPR